MPQKNPVQWLIEQSVTIIVGARCKPDVGVVVKPDQNQDQEPT